MGGTLYSKTGEIQKSHQAVPEEGKNWEQESFIINLHDMEDRPCVLFRVLQNT